MPSKPYPPDVLKQARRVLNAWFQIDEQLAFGSMNTVVMTAAIEEASAVEEELIDLRNRLTDVLNRRDAANKALWDKVKRARAGIRASFGDDSPEYDLIGGTPISDKKSPRRKIAAAE